MLSNAWDFVDSLPCPPIDNMGTFLLITVSVAVIGSLILLQPVSRQ